MEKSTYLISEYYVANVLNSDDNERRRIKGRIFVGSCYATRENTFSILFRHSIRNDVFFSQNFPTHINQSFNTGRSVKDTNFHESDTYNTNFNKL